MIMAEFVFSPNSVCSFITVEVFFFCILFEITLNAFSKFMMASYSLLMIFIRKAPYLYRNFTSVG